MPNHTNPELTLTSSEAEESLTAEQIEKIVEQSEPFIGKWNNLISTTNWEKGAIISRWRAELRDEGAPPAAWSDERWSKMVGGVTPQHVGRLRRTHERFGHVYEDFKGIYWSHFYAALDWDDAELWLEGSVQNGWSVSQMRGQRWETLGGLPENRPDPKDIVVVEAAEETQSLAIAERSQTADREIQEGPLYEGPDFGDEPDPDRGSRQQDEASYLDVASGPETSSGTSGTGVRPFEAFTDLPADVSDAAGAFKVSIIKHRAAEWEEISLEDMLGLLDALKQLARDSSS